MIEEPSQVSASDLNDGDILTGTTQVPCGKDGSQFRYAIPGGKAITSECINPDQKKQALRLWVDAVKQTVVANVKAEREETTAKIRRLKADANRENEAAAAVAMGLIRRPSPPSPPSVQSSDASSQEAPPHAQHATEPDTAPGVVATPDPLALAKAQLVQAAFEVQELSPRLDNAQRRVKQWQAVLNVLQAAELAQDSSVLEAGKHVITFYDSKQEK